MLQILDNHPTSKELHPNGQTRIKAAAAIIGVHHQTLRRWWKADKFPKPTDIHGIMLFRNADLLTWIAKSHNTFSDEA
ncbi:helix-turn-helix transcriptional regulator [Psychrobacter sp. R86515]|uniref:helix-turn-helix transcriptional regulator n=1 Tax=Psychrobacter sp. R86515 TaxID=3093855 RepID=UPI0036D28795|tara:strand:+ start:100 stop:333 length:234 start_codon:yes stop_codon:yes gene_type:complete